MKLLEQVIGFYEWQQLNHGILVESNVSGNFEIFTVFNFDDNPNLIHKQGQLYPNLDKLRSASAEQLTEFFNTYLSDFKIEQNLSFQYFVKSESIEEPLALNLDIKDISVQISKYSQNEGVINFNFIDAIRKNSIRTNIENLSKVEVVLKDEINLVPEDKILTTLLDSSKPAWLSAFDAGELNSDLESILISNSVGDAFVNKTEISKLEKTITSFVLFELYSKEIIKSVRVSREVIDLVKIDQEIGDKEKEIIDQMYKGEFSEDQAKEAMRFIKHLTSTLRIKSGKIKDKADVALANIMTAAEESNSIKKLMDVLTN